MKMLSNEIDKDKIDEFELLKQFLVEEKGIPIDDIELLDYIDNVYYIWIKYDNGKKLLRLIIWHKE